MGSACQCGAGLRTPSVPTPASGRRRDDTLRRVEPANATLDDSESRLLAAVARIIDALDSYVAAARARAEVHSALDGREPLSHYAEHAARLRPLLHALGPTVNVALDLDPQYVARAFEPVRVELEKHEEGKR